MNKTSTLTYKGLLDKYANFISPAVSVTIGDKTYTSSEVLMTSVEVELTANGTASGCTINISGQYDLKNSKWKNDFPDNVKPGATLKVSIGYVEKKEIFYGYIDDYSVEYSGNQGASLVINGLDGLGYLMHLQEPLYAGQQTPKTIIETILTKSKTAGFATSVSVGNLSGFSTPIVKEQISDWKFLNLVAARYGAVLFAIDGELIFDDMLSNTTALMTLGVQAGLRSFSRRVSLAHQIGKVIIKGRDDNQAPIEGSADSVSLQGTSGKSASEYVSNLSRATLREYSEYVRTADECTTLAQNRLNMLAMEFVSGEGTCIGIPDLIPGRYITISGLDDDTNNTYFMTRVKHSFTPEEYSTTFEVRGAKI